MAYGKVEQESGPDHVSKAPCGMQAGCCRVPQAGAGQCTDVGLWPCQLRQVPLTYSCDAKLAAHAIRRARSSFDCVMLQSQWTLLCTVHPTTAQSCSRVLVEHIACLEARLSIDAGS